jgi:hypothetical protein
VAALFDFVGVIIINRLFSNYFSLIPFIFLIFLSSCPNLLSNSCSLVYISCWNFKSLSLKLCFFRIVALSSSLYKQDEGNTPFTDSCRLFDTGDILISNSLLWFLSLLVEFFLFMKVLTARNTSLLAGLWSPELLALLARDCCLLMVFRRLAASRSGFARLNELELELVYSRSS